MHPTTHRGPCLPSEGAARAVGIVVTHGKKGNEEDHTTRYRQLKSSRKILPSLSAVSCQMSRSSAFVASELLSAPRCVLHARVLLPNRSLAGLGIESSGSLAPLNVYRLIPEHFSLQVLHSVFCLALIIEVHECECTLGVESSRASLAISTNGFAERKSLPLD